MNLKKVSAAMVLITGLTATASVQAHRAWMLPSATVLSGEQAWVTVDGAVSNSLFYFEHHPLNLDELQIRSPSGSPVLAQNKAIGKYRSIFRSEEHTSELQSRPHLVCRLLLEKKRQNSKHTIGRWG